MRVAQSSDDVEECLSDGAMYLDSSDLELGVELGGWGEQVVGLRFQGVDIPRGTPIASAHLEFVTDEIAQGASSLEIRGQAVDDAPTFALAGYDVTSRPVTTASVSWSPPDWAVLNETHQSPDVAVIVQEIVNRSGWSAGNNLVLVISGTGTRPAKAYDLDPSAAPLLHVE